MAATRAVLILAALAFFMSCSEARVQRRELFFFGLPSIQPSQCWQSVIGTKHCGADLFSSIFTYHLQLSYECCAALEGINDSCFHNFFSILPFNPILPPHVKALCALAQAGGAVNGSTSSPAPVAEPTTISSPAAEGPSSI